MARLDWDDSFSVGNSEIDEQHKRWIAIYNTMHDTMLSDDIPSVTAMATQALQDMHDYALHHFKFEEEYMASLDYPDLVAHRRLHKDFEGLIYRYNREVQEGHTILNTSLLKIIRNWLVEHILNEDQKYATFAQKG